MGEDPHVDNPTLDPIYEAAVSLFNGDDNAAMEWLNAPARGLGGMRPIDKAQSEAGTREVLVLIARLIDGVFS